MASKKILLCLALMLTFLIGLWMRGVMAKEATEGKMIEESDAGEYFTLGLIGFNYTDRLIDHYSVDSSGGGHVHLSSPTSGGSGVVCCTRISKAQREKVEVKVKWQVDGCTYPVKSSTGRIGERRIFYYKEALTYVDPPTSSAPAYLETHFYPDGSVKVKVTEFISTPEIPLDQDRKDQSIFLRCKDEKKSG
jgi:hypothetical protein